MAKTRISLPLKEDGSGFDFSQMRETTKRQLAEMVNADAAEILAAGGFTTEPLGEEPAPDLFGGITIENIRTGLDIISQTNALVLRMLAPRFMPRHPFKKDPKTGRPAPMSIAPDIAMQAFALTPEQHAELDPRALRLAQKYSNRIPEWMKKNMDVYILACMYIKYTGQNAMKAMKAQIDRDISVAKWQRAQQRDTKPVDTDKPPEIKIQEEESNSVPTDYMQPPADGEPGQAAA